ncbi:hypothetical protein [Thioalkalivibrio sp. ALE16]|uniref:hypothetical protein n=1 Tax=Thioalkalivibrio sp. ALE16 TaxID=1158172 RepID=UPI000368B4AF|nr:hypothetical protein [Thioalkalivibrio sp. ALE16]
MVLYNQSPEEPNPYKVFEKVSRQAIAQLGWPEGTRVFKAATRADWVEQFDADAEFDRDQEPAEVLRAMEERFIQEVPLPKGWMMVGGQTPEGDLVHGFVNTAAGQ